MKTHHTLSIIYLFLGRHSQKVDNALCSSNEEMEKAGRDIRQTIKSSMAERGFSEGSSGDRDVVSSKGEKTDEKSEGGGDRFRRRTQR